MPNWKDDDRSSELISARHIGRQPMRITREGKLCCVCLVWWLAGDPRLEHETPPVSLVFQIFHRFVAGVSAVSMQFGGKEMGTSASEASSKL